MSDHNREIRGVRLLGLVSPVTLDLLPSALKGVKSRKQCKASREWMRLGAPT